MIWSYNQKFSHLFRYCKYSSAHLCNGLKYTLLKLFAGIVLFIIIFRIWRICDKNSDKTYENVNTTNCLISKQTDNNTVKNVGDDSPEQIITIEENGRFGNLMLEAATLFLIGKQLNVTVYLLPQVAAKMSPFFSRLPLNPIDNSKHCVCIYCTSCTCSQCNKWTVTESWTFRLYSELYIEKYMLLRWFDANLVINSLPAISSMYRKNLNTKAVAKVQEYLHALEKPGHIFVGIHVRRKDYPELLQIMYQGHGVDRSFYLYCMDHFRSIMKSLVFLIISDDITWCRDNLSAVDVVFPNIEAYDEMDATVNDFTLLTQANHSVFDYGSFGFWGSALAGGEVLVADGHSDIDDPILMALKIYRQPGWTFVDINKIDQSYETTTAPKMNTANGDIAVLTTTKLYNESYNKY